MNDPHAAHGHDHGAPAVNPFTPAEWDALRAADVAAARAVVVLMVTIFCIGIVLYSIVNFAIVS